MIVRGDCVEVMARMPAGSVDVICTDPPYGLEFMGKAWDKLGDVARANRGTQPDRKRPPGESGDSQKFQLPSPAFDLSRESQRAMQEWHERWAREALRVLKPGGYLLAFGGTRTYHRLACAVEDAGFEIRDRVLVEGVEAPHPVELDWLYGSGFPKSLDVPKAIDKAKGAAGTWRQEDHAGRPGIRKKRNSMIGQTDHATVENPDGLRHVYESASVEAARWQGWGTALKPAHEPICVARKPLSGTVAESVLAHGTGALNIDGCRIEGAVPSTVQGQSDRAGEVFGADQRDQREFVPNGGGRWPANVVLLHREDCERVGEKVVKGSNWREGAGVATGESSVALSGGADGSLNTKAGKGYADEDGMETVEAWECAPGCPVAALDVQTGVLTSGALDRSKIMAPNRIFGARPKDLDGTYDPNSGGASRFFYCAKASRSERNAGLVEHLPRARRARKRYQAEVSGRHAARCLNRHPTVKPVELMRWLVRLVTPPGGTVLDPFAGSGTTGIAAGLEGFEFVGVEQDGESAATATARCAYWAEHGEAAVEVDRRERVRAAEPAPEFEQLGFL